MFSGLQRRWGNGKDSGSESSCAVLGLIFVLCLVYFGTRAASVQLCVENLAYIDAPCQQPQRGLVSPPSEQSLVTGKWVA